MDTPSETLPRPRQRFRSAPGSKTASGSRVKKHAIGDALITPFGEDDSGKGSNEEQGSDEQDGSDQEYELSFMGHRHGRQSLDSRPGFSQLFDSRSPSLLSHDFDSRSDSRLGRHVDSRPHSRPHLRLGRTLDEPTRAAPEAACTEEEEYWGRTRDAF